MKTTSNKPLTAYEVYALKKTSDSPVQSPLSIGKMKKKKRKQAIEAKKLKRAGILTEEAKEKSTCNVVGRSGAVKPKQFGKKKKEKGLTQSDGVEINGINGSEKKLKKKKKQVRGLGLPRVENGNDNVSDGASATETGKKTVRKKTKADVKKFKIRKERGNLAKEFRNVDPDRHADLKKKIAEVKRLVKKKAANKSKPSTSIESHSDQSFGCEGDSDDDDEFESGEEMNDSDELTFNVQTFTAKELNAVNSQDSRKQGEETFQWIIKPYSEDEFFSKFWEKKPLLIKRKEESYYKGLFSTKDFDKILHEEVVLYSKNLDVTSYSDGKRETHNPVGQAHAPVVWDYYNNGCSLRLLNPQTFHPRVWKCLASLQEYFNSFCGANVYLTPPDTQGFAPHWDDIEAFVVQLEGKKRWRVYSPRCDEEVLPDYSSANLTDDSIGEPILDTVLEPGDLLYFPRGYIHQGHAVENEHSLHITLSTYQKNAWGHYLEKLLPQALSLAMSEDVEFRRGLPRGYLDYMGIVHMEKESEERTAFKKKVCDLVMRMMDKAPLDASVDQRGSSFMHDCLPPYLTKEDKICSAYGGGERWSIKKKKVINRVELQPDTPIRLIRGNCIRLVAEEENVNIYHCLENSREYHKEEPQFLEVAAENAPAIETLLHTYPSYVAIESLPLADEGEKMTIASGLWERGLLVTAHPLDAQYDD